MSLSEISGPFGEEPCKIKPLPVASTTSRRGMIPGWAGKAAHVTREYNNRETEREPNSDGFQPRSNGLQPGRNGLQPNSDGLQPRIHGLQPRSNGLQPHSDGLSPKRMLYNRYVTWKA